MTFVTLPTLMLARASVVALVYPIPSICHLLFAHPGPASCVWRLYYDYGRHSTAHIFTGRFTHYRLCRVPC